MSTTNPEHGPPVGGLTSTPADSPRADDHGGIGPPAADTIARGHEVDTYDTTSVFSVPLLVVLFFVLAFGTVTVLAHFLLPNPPAPDAHPMAVEDNQKDIPDRHAQVTDPPLDNFRPLQGHSRSISSPERPTGGSPWIHPEDLRVNSTNTPALFRSGWLDAGKTRARVTIDEAMDVAAKKDSKVLKARATPVAPTSSQNVPTAANAGRGEGSSKAIPPKDPTPAPPPTKGEGKKGQGKKGKM